MRLVITPNRNVEGLILDERLAVAESQFGATDITSMDTICNVNLEDAPPEGLPQCPYCKKDLNTIWVKTSGLGFKGQKEILMCPNCKAFLGYNAWKR